MANKSDKPFILRWIIGCAAVILLFHLAWAKYLLINYGNGLFTIIDGGLIGAFIIEALGAYKRADDPNKDWKRWAFIILALAVSIWAAAWSVTLMDRITQGING